ncbi:MAG: transposase [Deltaproteobacteria bacterium]
MATSSPQLGFEFRTWGGARKGAGRKPKGDRPGVSHLRRPSHSRHHPLHVTLRVQRGVSSLRERSLFPVVRKALAAAKQQFEFSLVHFSVQRDHLHLIAEAVDRRALSRGVQGLSIRVARAVNHQLGRKGRLFADRYHARALKTPREVRFALRYVLLNARKHVAEGRAGGCAGFVDSRSSAAWFSGFGRPRELAFGAQQVRSEWFRTSGSTDPPVAEASVWLLRVGQRSAGCFDLDETPGG